MSEITTDALSQTDPTTKGVNQSPTPQGKDGPDTPPAGDLSSNEGTQEVRTPETQPESDNSDRSDTFPREYVEKLRKEAADNRAKAKHAEALQRELFTLRVSALDKLHSADDMPFDENLLGDPEALAKAVDDLLKAKPYLARQKVTGNVLQGATPVAPKVSLIDMLRG